MPYRYIFSLKGFLLWRNVCAMHMLLPQLEKQTVCGVEIFADKLWAPHNKYSGFDASTTSG